MDRFAAVTAIGSKDRDYEEEGEWRYIALPFDRNSSLPICRDKSDRRYLKLPFRSHGLQLSLAEVIVHGPDPEAALAKARSILEEAKYLPGDHDVPPVHLSEHP